jgi:serine/threonine protein kinase
MQNLLTYNLTDLDKTQISNINLKYVQTVISSFNETLVVKKYLGSSFGGDIFLIKNTNNTTATNKKLICKKIPLSSSITKLYIQKYYKIIEYIYINSSVKQYINPILDYKIKSNNLYLLFPYYTGYNLQQLKKKMLKMDNETYKIIMKHLVKKILQGLSILHKQGLYHQNINPNCIIVNTDNRKLEVKIKFYDLSINNSITKNRTKKLNNKNIKLRKKDCRDCGNLLLDLISFKYIEEYNNSNNTGLLNKALQFFNIKKREKEIDEIVDSELVKYMNVIDDKMIKKQTNVNKVLKEILFKEKYKE